MPGTTQKRPCPLDGLGGELALGSPRTVPCVESPRASHCCCGVSAAADGLLPPSGLPSGTARAAGLGKRKWRSASQTRRGEALRGTQLRQQEAPHRGCLRDPPGPLSFLGLLVCKMGLVTALTS